MNRQFWVLRGNRKLWVMMIVAATALLFLLAVPTTLIYAESSQVDRTALTQGDGDEDPTATPDAPDDTPTETATEAVGSSALDDGDDTAAATTTDNTATSTESSPEDDAVSDDDGLQMLGIGIVVGLVLGVVPTMTLMRRRIGTLRAELKDAQRVIEAYQPQQGQRRKPRLSDETNPRATAAAKKIGGQSLIRTGQVRQAYLMFLDAIEQDEDDDEAWLWAGVAAMKMRQYDIAQQTLLRARLLGNEKAEDALRKLKEVLDRQEQAKQARRMREAAAVPPSMAEMREATDESGKTAIQHATGTDEVASSDTVDPDEPLFDDDELDAEPKFDF